jgi:hypothetical protein
MLPNVFGDRGSAPEHYRRRGYCRPLPGNGMVASTESDTTTDEEVPEGHRTLDAREINGKPVAK